MKMPGAINIAMVHLSFSQLQQTDVHSIVVKTRAIVFALPGPQPHANPLRKALSAFGSAALRSTAEPRFYRMKVRILGCSGAIGGPNLRTTSMLVDDDILIDAGSGVGELSMVDLARIDHVFLTHSHLDHTAFLPLMLDAVGEVREQPLTVYATQATCDALCTHLFNWIIWPDFRVIPDAANPFLRFQPIGIGETVTFGTRKITALSAMHTVPAVGYRLDSGTASLVFSGDTTTNDAFWEEVNAIPDLRYLLIETSFVESERPLAILSKHLCPSLLREELQKLKGNPEIFITHLKPGHGDRTMREIQESIRDRDLRMLQHNQTFQF
jgi:ribonuclease BN (tRNA processing enzyme)